MHLFVCTVCDKQRKRMTKQSQLRRHDKMHKCIPCNIPPISHNMASTETIISKNDSSEEQKSTQSETIEVLDNDILSLDEEQIYEEDIVDWINPLKKKDLLFNSEECNNYFLEETAGMGNEYLCGYSHFHLRNISDKLKKKR